MPASRIPRTFTAAAASVGVTAAAPSLLRCLLVAALLSVGLRPVSAFSSLSECSSGLGPLPPANGSLLSHFYSNTAFAPSASQPYATNSTYAYSRSLAFRFPESLPASFLPAASLSPFSFQVHGHLRAEFDALYAFTCHYDSSELSVRLWLDDKLLCPSDANNVDLQLPFAAGQLLHLRMEVIQRGHWAPQLDPHLEVLWSSGLGVYTAIPSSALVGCLSTPRLQQLAMHERQLTTSGWDQLFNSDFLTQTLLPHSLALTVALYRLSTASFRKGLTPQRASNGLNSTSSFRIGNRTWVGDTGVPYQSLELLWEGLTLQLETTSNRSSNELTVLITGLSAANYSDYRIVIITSYLWGRLGNCTALDSQTPGQPFALCDTAGIAPAIPLYSSAAVASNQLPGVDSAALGGIAAFAFPEPSSQWAGPVLAFTTGSVVPVEESQRQIQAAAAVVAAAPCLPSPLQSVPSPPAEECQLIQTALAWLTIYTPYEGLILVVARDWDAGYGYVLFEWDSFFSVVMLASFDSAFAQQLAVATYVQMVKTSTLLPDGTGFVPNYASGPRQSRDRTEPPIAAKVLLEMLKAWGTDHPALQWVVPLCFPDLLRENGWFWAHRRAEPLLLITLGSDPNLPIGGDIDVNNLQAAMFESGLDNSPMSDGSSSPTAAAPSRLSLTLPARVCALLQVRRCWIRHEHAPDAAVRRRLHFAVPGRLSGAAADRVADRGGQGGRAAARLALRHHVARRRRRPVERLPRHLRQQARA